MFLLGAAGDFDRAGIRPTGSAAERRHRVTVEM